MPVYRLSITFIVHPYCQLVPFIEVILVTAVEYYREDPARPKGEDETNTEDSMSMVLMDMYAGKKHQNSPKKKKNAVGTSDSKKKARREKVRNPFANIRKWTCVPYLHTIGECPLIRVETNWRKQIVFQKQRLYQHWLSFSPWSTLELQSSITTITKTR